ncbi:Cytochrome P450 monooxygenase 51 [Mycena sanguinolenta]|uniref:Cytochrome P450 monooxygenase 51 n=1 Tax=Mycena sanguinolenta TaxID=230812 RepID=A0A8H6ZJ11_9AGAR|nr:Cytochrome P450 monooxygenase 51 [Mycena sanguinolenta]
MDSSADTGRVSTAILTAAVLLGFAVLQISRQFFDPHSSLDAIPSFGIPSYPFGFYVGSWNFIRNGRAILKQGYLKYRGQPFKVALANQWLVLLSGQRLIEDVRKADDSLSFADAAKVMFQTEYTIGYEQLHDPFQMNVIRTALTRNIAACFPVIREEIAAAFKDLIPAKDEWICVPAMKTILPIVTRVSNRVFIGLLCRDPDYIKLTTQYTLNVSSNAQWLHVTPSFLRPLAARLFGHLEPATRAAMKHLRPILQHRIAMDDKYGPDWPEGDRPNDMISWLLDEARGHPTRRTVRRLTRTLLNINFAASHTTTHGILHALYTLAANLECVQPLREELESVVAAEGWTKQAMDQLVKMDSFLKESSQTAPTGAIGSVRMATKDFSFSDGTMVPAGTLLAVPVFAEHHDEVNYSNAEVFDPFRFSRMREQDGEENKHQMVTPTLEYLSFGLGRHACPGRFFAVNEQKLILSHIIMTYDFKLRDGVDEWIAVLIKANTTAQLMFRKRR